jgi:hypothetical protein
MLGAIAQRAHARLQISWPQKGPLVQLARSLGSEPAPTGQWLLRLPDTAEFVRRLGPLLERRLADTGRADLTADLCLNLYRNAYELQFDHGRLSRVEDVGFVDASMGAKGGDLNIPPEAFIRLLFGYRNLDELRDAWPDTYATPESRRVVETLFPEMLSHFCMPYHVFRG